MFCEGSQENNVYSHVRKEPLQVSWSDVLQNMRTVLSFDGSWQWEKGDVSASRPLWGVAPPRRDWLLEWPAR